MADQIPTVPHDQDTIHSISSVEQLLLFDDNNNNDDDNPLLDDAVNGMMEEMSGDVVGNHETHFPRMCNEHETTPCTDPPRPPEFGNPIRIPVWPVPPSPHSCSCCQTLREIFHVNGGRVMKLVIHGRLGLINHAVMERYDSKLSSDQNHEYYMFDFCRESISNVKQFLVQYCNDRKSEGYIMLQDPLSNFYNALCTGLEPGFPPHRTSGGDGQTSKEGGLNRPEEEGNGVRLPKSYIASQSRGKEQET